MSGKGLSKYRQRILDASGDAEELMIIEKDVNIDSDLKRDERRALLEGIKANMKKEVVKEKIASADTDVKPLVGDEVDGRKVLAERKTIDNVSIIGHLAGYTIGSCAIPNELVMEYWEKFGIDKEFRPRFCRQKDAFKNACASMERVEKKNESPKGWSNRTLYVDWVAKQLSQTEYMLTREEIAVKGRLDTAKKQDKRTLNFHKICKFRLVEVESDEKGSKGGKKDTKIQFLAVAQSKEFEELSKKLLKELEAKIEWYMAHTNDKRLRDAIRETIRKCGGVNFTMGQGGAWFIPITAETQVSQYKEFFKFVDETYRIGHNPVLIRTIPLIDDYDVRAQIEEDVVREVAKQMERRLNKTLKSLTGLKPEVAEKMLEKKLLEHGKSIDLMERYKNLLARDIKVELETPDPDAIRLSGHQELSGRSKALLRMLTTTEQDED